MKQESADPQVLAVVETKFAWIVHIIAAIVKTKQLSGYRYCQLYADFNCVVNPLDLPFT